jgi:hypothetical protein
MAPSQFSRAKNQINNGNNRVKLDALGNQTYPHPTMLHDWTLRGLSLCDGLPAVVEYDVPQAGCLYKGHSDPVRFIMRRDFDVATPCDNSVDGLRISGLHTDNAT